MDQKFYEEWTRGIFQKGTAKGKEETIYGLQTYVVGNTKDPRAIIVIHHDLFGLPFINNKLLADAYANSGDYLVYLSDFSGGNPAELLDTDGDLTTPLASRERFRYWLNLHTSDSYDFIRWDFLKALRRATPSNRKIGMVGLCFGGRFALRAAREQNKIDINGKQISLIDAAVVMHPSFMEHTLAEDVDTIVVPTTMGWDVKDGIVDFRMLSQVEDLQAKEQKAGKKVFMIEHENYYPGRYGFSTRGNLKDSSEKEIAERSLAQGVNWFKKYL